jgi:hypothetical protein
MMAMTTSSSMRVKPARRGTEFFMAFSKRHPRGGPDPPGRYSSR